MKDILAEGAKRNVFSGIYRKLGGKYICCKCREIVQRHQRFSASVTFLFSIISIGMILLLTFCIVLLFMIFITTMDPYAGKVFAGIILKYLVSILFFLAVIAVIIINYTKSSKCYKCGSRKLLLINSPKGKELLRQYYPEKFKLIEEIEDNVLAEEIKKNQIYRQIYQKLGGKYICCECGEILKSSKKFYVTFINATLITCSVVLVIFLGFMQRSHILLWNSWDFNHGYFNTGFDNLLHEVIFETLNNLVPMGIISHAGGNELRLYLFLFPFHYNRY